MTENKIHSILTDFDIFISEGEISNILTKEKSDVFSAENAAIFETGMKCAKYFQTDSTGARHSGKNGDMHYIGNEEFSTYYIKENRKRETIRKRLGLLEGVLTPTPMLTDSANQYDGIACHYGYCRLHEIQHYIKLKPYLDLRRSIPEKFIASLWKFYDLLKKFCRDRVRTCYGKNMGRHKKPLMKQMRRPYSTIQPLLSSRLLFEKSLRFTSLIIAFIMENYD